MSAKKCPQCKGTGMVQVAPNARGVKKCPSCRRPAGSKPEGYGEGVRRQA